MLIGVIRVLCQLISLISLISPNGDFGEMEVLFGRKFCFILFYFIGKMGVIRVIREIGWFYDNMMGLL